MDTISALMGLCYIIDILDVFVTLSYRPVSCADADRGNDAAGW